MNDLKDIDDLENDYFVERNKKGIFISIEMQPSLSFNGFQHNFSINEEDEKIIEKKEKKQQTINVTTINPENTKSLL
jgi:hypothetical protein